MTTHSLPSWIRLSRHLSAVPNLSQLRLDAPDGVESVSVESVLDLLWDAVGVSDSRLLADLHLADAAAAIPLTRHNAAVLRSAMRRRR